MRPRGGTDIALRCPVRSVITAIEKLVEMVSQAAPLRPRPSLVPVPVLVTQRPAPRAGAPIGALLPSARRWVERAGAPRM